MKRKLTNLISSFSATEEQRKEKQLETLYDSLVDQIVDLRADLTFGKELEKQFKLEVSKRKSLILVHSKEDSAEARDKVIYLEAEIEVLKKNRKKLNATIEKLDNLLKEGQHASQVTCNEIKTLHIKNVHASIPKKVEQNLNILKDTEKLISNYESQILALESGSKKKFEELIAVSDNSLQKLEPSNLKFLSNQLSSQVNALDEAAISLLEVKQKLDEQYRTDLEKKHEWQKRLDLVKEKDAPKLAEDIQEKFDMYERSVLSLEIQLKEIDSELTSINLLKNEYSLLVKRVEDQIRLK